MKNEWNVNENEMKLICVIESSTEEKEINKKFINIKPN